MLSPFAILDIEDKADDATVRAAYIRALRVAVRNAEKRLAYRVLGPPPLGRVEDVFDLIPDERRHVGPAAWLNVLREPQR